MIVGILALQGAFIEHEKILQQLGVGTVQVRKAEQLEDIDGLIIPGGESTTIGKLIKEFAMEESLRKRAQEGMPFYGTCAGLILLAKDITESDQFRLGFMNIKAHRNAFGRQVDSFEAALNIPVIGGEPFRGVFIRAPYIQEVNRGVEVLAQYGDKIVMAREGQFLVTAFHPELTEDTRIHRYFLHMIEEAGKK